MTVKWHTHTEMMHNLLHARGADPQKRRTGGSSCEACPHIAADIAPLTKALY